MVSLALLLLLLAVVSLALLLVVAGGSAAAHAQRDARRSDSRAGDARVHRCGARV